MTNLIQKLFALLLLAIGIGFTAPSLLSAVGPEQADEALLISGFAVGLFIVRRRLSAERLTP